MNTYERRKMEMLESVDQFGKKPELTLTAIITVLLATVSTSLAAMRNWVAGQLNGQGGYREGAAERRGLKNEIYATLRDMREIAKGLELAGNVGVSEQFRLPARLSYALVLATARSFVTNATPMEAVFTGRGMPATFLADLTAKITAFDTATGGKHDGSTAALRAAGDAGLEAVQQLRTIMRVHLRSSPELLPAWTSASRIARSAPSEPEEGTTPAPTPPSGS
jgi:hypothetical protein